MKKAMFLVAILAAIATAIYLIVKFFFWYILGVVVAVIILHVTEKPMLLAPDDPRFDY